MITRRRWRFLADVIISSQMPLSILLCLLLMMRFAIVYLFFFAITLRHYADADAPLFSSPFSSFIAISLLYRR